MQLNLTIITFIHISNDETLYHYVVLIITWWCRSNCVIFLCVTLEHISNSYQPDSYQRKFLLNFLLTCSSSNALNTIPCNKLYFHISILNGKRSNNEMYNKSFIPFLGVLTLFGIANGKSNQTNDEQRNLCALSNKTTVGLMYHIIYLIFSISMLPGQQKIFTIDGLPLVAGLRSNG